MGTPHRSISIDVFTFDQLSDEAKEKARDWWRGLEAGDPAWSNENRQSMEAFADHFGIKVSYWEYDAYNYSATVRQGPIRDEIWELSGVRLATYLWNNYSDVLVEPKAFGKRKSQVMKELTSCPFTGYCMDDTLLDPVREHISSPRAGTTFEDVMTSCILGCAKACSADMAWQMEDDQVDETILSNEYEFDVTGKVI